MPLIRKMEFSNVLLYVITSKTLIRADAVFVPLQIIFANVPFPVYFQMLLKL